MSPPRRQGRRHERRRTDRAVRARGREAAGGGSGSGSGGGTGGGEHEGAGALFLLCDGDLGDCAGELAALVEAVSDGRGELAIAAFREREGGGFGLARGFARRAIRSRCGLELDAPLSGQRALAGDLLGRLLPFADGYGMELGMTIDAARAGARVYELELPLGHRVRGRTPAGFAHRGRQLLDLLRADRARAGGGA